MNHLDDMFKLAMAIDADNIADITSGKASFAEYPDEKVPNVQALTRSQTDRAEIKSIRLTAKPIELSSSKTRTGTGTERPGADPIPNRSG